MSAILKSDLIFRVTTFDMIQNEFKEYSKAVQHLKEQFLNYSISDYKEMSWIISKDVKDYRISFQCYEKYGSNIVDMTKLYCIFLLMGGKRGDIGYLGEFFYFLQQNQCDISQVDKFIFIKYAEYLKNIGNASVTCFGKFSMAKAFIQKLQGHPHMCRMEGISLIEVPFPAKTVAPEEHRYKVIKKEVLEKLDAYFTLNKESIHLRVAYWLLRLYALRPSEVTKAPLHCVEKINDSTAIMRKYVAKGKSPIETKFGFYYHELEYLDLGNPQMRMLFELIEYQQKIAMKLYNSTTNKGLLLAYKTKRGFSRILLLSNDTLRENFIQIQENIGIDINDVARPRDFKKTGITHRAEMGWSNQELKRVANHESSTSMDSYSQPSKNFIFKKQSEIMILEGTMKEKYMFKGKIINGTSDAIEKKILSNPRAHKVADMGYCPDVTQCGNHFACLDCEYLLPDKELEGYYYEQSMRYISIAKKQYELGQGINAKDSLHRATFFTNLYNRVNGTINV